MEHLTLHGIGKKDLNYYFARGSITDKTLDIKKQKAYSEMIEQIKGIKNTGSRRPIPPQTK